jgi:GntR family transcriptional regulator
MEYEFNDKAPIYLQIINYIKKDIIGGKLNPGEKLPSVRELAAELKVNPNTVSRVYQEIEREGITYTQRGMGTYIKEDVEMVLRIKREMAEETIKEFLENMKRLGFTKEDVVKLVEDKWGERIGV